MLGSIAGDIIGSRFERHPIKSTEFELFTKQSHFTDDTVLTCAIAEAVSGGGDYAGTMRKIARRYPDCGYGGSFKRWLFSDDAGPYGSYGNGSAMRVAPIGFAFFDEAQVLAEAKRSAECTHNHPEGIKGAQAVALAIFMARRGTDKETIRREITARFGYDLDRKLDDIRPHYRFDVSCQGSVPESIIAFLESESIEHAIRLAVSLGGDSDTMACIAGGIAEAYYKTLDVSMIASSCVRLSIQLATITEQFAIFHRRLPIRHGMKAPWNPYEMEYRTGDIVYMRTPEEIHPIHEYFMQYLSAFAKDWMPLEWSITELQGVPLVVGMVHAYHGGIPLAFVTFVHEGKPLEIRVMQAMVRKGEEGESLHLN